MQGVNNFNSLPTEISLNKTMHCEDVAILVNAQQIRN